MTNQEIKDELFSIRPNKPHKTDGRRTQQAIDEAIEIIDKYEGVLKLITREGIT